ncbi:MAG: potassium channel family protein [Bacillota bacterium]|nr:potassium channel family protein [Bacillota bacterium]
MANTIYIKFLRLPLLVRILMITLVFVLLFGIAIHLLEPATFPTIHDGIWWAIVTASTVGYGDLVPQTLPGRFAAVILILLGAGFVSSYFVTLAASAVTKQNAFSEGKLAYKGKGHIVIVGWNERSRELIKNLSNVHYPKTILLIDETLQTNPIQSRYVHYIQGRPHLDETLIKSNIFDADKVLITADQGNEEVQADMNSILTLLAIKGLSPKTACIVEILTAEQVVNANRAGANLILQSNQLTSMYMMNCLLSHRANLLPELLELLQENRLQEFLCEEQWWGLMFLKVATNMLADQKILIGIKRGEEIHLNPPQDLLLKEKDILILIK